MSSSYDVGFSDKEYTRTPTFTLEKDAFFSNMIVGIRYNGSETRRIKVIKSPALLAGLLAKNYSIIKV